MSKKSNSRKRRNLRKLYFISGITALSIIFSSIIIYNKYIDIKCKDLYFAVEHQMIKGNENRLLRVQNFTPLFIDKDMAVLEAYGLNKVAPHAKSTYKAYFKKKSNSSWELIKSIPVE